MLCMILAKCAVYGDIVEVMVWSVADQCVRPHKTAEATTVAVCRGHLVSLFDQNLGQHAVTGEQLLQPRKQLFVARLLFTLANDSERLIKLFHRYQWLKCIVSPNPHLCGIRNVLAF